MDPNKQLELVRELREGSQNAFALLYLSYVDQLYGYAYKLTKSTTDAEEIVQESFLRVWKYRDRLSSELSFKSYLFHISYHLIVDKFRSHVNMVDIDTSSTSSLSDKNDIEELLDYADTYKRLGVMLGELSERQQQIFTMSRKDGLSAKEIGAKLNISEKTVHNQLTMIIRKLKPLLEDTVKNTL